MAELRVGVLGAARITPSALIRPARAVDGVTVAAIAARDRGRAAAAATRHGIPVVHDDYAALIADPALDAVYIPLPNGLHAQWTLAAIGAGKHVLCEKPFTSNADQARAVAEAAAGSGRVVMEAFHYRYHPLMARVLTLLADGTIGEIRRVETELAFPLPRFNDIRYSLPLAGGALMDAGCYAVHALRTLAGTEPQVRLGAGHPPLARCGPGHGGAAELSGRGHRSRPVLDVVTPPARCQRPRRRERR